MLGPAVEPATVDAPHDEVREDIAYSRDSRDDAPPYDEPPYDEPRERYDEVRERHGEVREPVVPVAREPEAAAEPHALRSERPSGRA